MSLVQDLKTQFNATERRRLETALGTIYVGPLTIHQAQQINREGDIVIQAARHFQVRAKDAEGQPIVPPGDFDEFCRLVSSDAVADAVNKMVAGDASLEDAEKN